MEVNNNNKIKSSLSNGTNDREACPKFWIACLVQMNCEKKAEEKLNQLGFETYLPIQKEERLWSDRCKLVERIVIPMIVFVKVASKKECEIVRNFTFVYKLLCLPGVKDFFYPIPNEQIEKLRFLLTKSESEVILISDLRVGDSVKIKKGPLRGLEGVLCEIDENKPMVAVGIDLLGYACVKVFRDDIKCIDKR